MPVTVAFRPWLPGHFSAAAANVVATSRQRQTTDKSPLCMVGLPLTFIGPPNALTTGRLQWAVEVSVIRVLLIIGTS